MGTLGFSYVGLAFLLMLFVPNAIWTKQRPEGYEALEKQEPKALLLLERTGQALTTCCALCFSDLNLHGWSAWCLWLLAAFLLLALYDVCWVRYFCSKRTLADFYGSQFGIIVPLATLPVAAFFLLGVYGRVIWLMASAALLGVGHIGIHLSHRKEVFA